MTIEIIEWASGDWMKIYIDGRLHFAHHASDWTPADWAGLMISASQGARVTWRYARPDEDERK